METDDDFHSQAVLATISFRLSTMQQTWKWREVFSGLLPGGPADCLVVKLSEGRDRIGSLLRTMSTTTTSPQIAMEEELIAELELYLPFLLQLLASLESQPPKQTNLALVFSWSGSFSTSYAPYTSKFIIFEVVEILHLLGTCSYSHGATLLKMGSVKPASVAFLKSSGYFLNLAVKTLPRWNRGNLETKPIPAELDEKNCLGASHLARAAAQQCAVSLALRNSAKHSVLAKLCASVVEEAVGSLQCLAASPLVATTCSAMAIHGAYLREIFNSLTFYYQGRDLLGSGSEKYGHAVAFFSMSEEKLRIQGGGVHDTSRPGLPRAFAASLSIGRLLTVVKEAHSSGKRDNDLIYFQVIPSFAELELPRGFSVIAPAMPTEIKQDLTFVCFHDASIAAAAATATATAASATAAIAAATSTDAEIIPSTVLAFESLTISGVHCPACTFENPSNSKNCSICNTIFSKGTEQQKALN